MSEKGQTEGKKMESNGQRGLAESVAVSGEKQGYKLTHSTLTGEKL